METAPTKWINGFSKLSKAAQREWVAEQYGDDPGELIVRMASFDHPDQRIQEGIDHFAENTIANYVMPLGIAPNFLIDGKTYAVPMAIEESSVVAAASAAAKYWGTRGGFKTTILGTTKVGQLFFEWNGEEAVLQELLPQLSLKLLERSKPHTVNMERRGGGVKGITLHVYPELPNTFELRGTFETRDSMGANFINTILECWGEALPVVLASCLKRLEQNGTKPLTEPRVLMGILSNYTPECVVRAEVSCHVSEMGGALGGFTADELAHRFHQAVQLARVSPYRATTHNKGIFNGIDAVVIATGNDFRAVEACGHAYAGRDGQYRSLSQSSIVDGQFRFWLDIPLALGTVGGLTKAHPLAATSLEILGQPGADELMRIVAATGLAQNFAAVRSLVTTGIQAGHMRMHLQNILTQLGAEECKRSEAEAYFADKTVSVAGVRAWLEA
ncbi:MAG: hydroxymethylglutaryl-CoA reductase [Saprospiraceae bacterium]